MELFFIIALIGLIAAAVNDIKKREVADWISYSLFAVLIAANAVQSIIYLDYSYIANAIVFSLGTFILMSALYYSKMVGGGDVKILTAIAPVFSFSMLPNFILFILGVSGIYGVLFSIVLGIKNFGKLRKELKFNFLVEFSLVFLVLAIIFKSIMLAVFSVILVIPYLIIFVSAVERVSLIKDYDAKKLTEGDWLVNNVHIRKKMIRATAEGLTKEDIAMIRKAGIKVKIREGIPYVPVFLISFILGYFIDVFSIIRAFF